MSTKVELCCFNRISCTGGAPFMQEMHRSACAVFERVSCMKSQIFFARVEPPYVQEVHRSAYAGFN